MLLFIANSFFFPLFCRKQNLLKASTVQSWSTWMSSSCMEIYGMFWENVWDHFYCTSPSSVVIWAMCMFFFFFLAYFFHIIRPTQHERKILNTFGNDLFTLRTAGRFHLNMQCINGDENVITQNIALQNGSIFQNNGLGKHMLMCLHRNPPVLATFHCILVGS